MISDCNVTWQRYIGPENVSMALPFSAESFFGLPIYSVCWQSKGPQRLGTTKCPRRQIKTPRLLAGLQFCGSNSLYDFSSDRPPRNHSKLSSSQNRAKMKIIDVMDKRQHKGGGDFARTRRGSVACCPNWRTLTNACC